MTRDGPSAVLFGFERLDSGRWRPESRVDRTPPTAELDGETFARGRSSGVTAVHRLATVSWTGS